MSRLDQFLDDSRVGRLIEQVENGVDDVDLRRILRLQALDVARAGELFALDCLEAERAADEQWGSG